MRSPLSGPTSRSPSWSQKRRASRRASGAVASSGGSAEATAVGAEGASGRPAPGARARATKARGEAQQLRPGEANAGRRGELAVADRLADLVVGDGARHLAAAIDVEAELVFHWGAGRPARAT